MVDHFSIAIITRTKDRPLLLPRVLTSLLAQSYKDYIWLIINDGGNPGSVDAVAKEAARCGVDVKVIHNSKSLGMESASNIGIANSSSEYIVIHDDDDSWEPSFLSTTVSFLSDKPDIVGVVTQTYKVVEEIVDDEVRIVSKEILNPDLVTIDLPVISMGNQFPPISFLFRRNIFNIVSGFDESLPVLGDWDFNLRVLLVGDIGVIPFPLANHHQRYIADSTQEAYGNTVTFGIDKHIEWESRYRNQKIRESLDNNTLGFLLYHGKHAQILYRELEYLRVAGSCWRRLISINDKYGIGLLRKFFSRSLSD